MFKKIIILLLLICLYFLQSFRITNTPMGLTVDEHAFGWNAALLSATGMDENGVKYPLFVNSINHKDWRQPVTQYYLTAFFKLFGTSVFNLRVSSVIISLISSLILFLLVSRLLNFNYGIFAAIIFSTTPIVFMHSHLGLDNIMPVPFTLMWLYSIYLYKVSRKQKYLILAAIALGTAFYTYKGMRAMTPVWASLTVFYILYLNYQSKIKLFKLLAKTTPFVLTILPFFLIIPYLHHLYPGAIFGGARPKFNNIYDLIYPYLSHFDLTFMFIKGDELLFHSTRIHGMYLLTTLPFFFIGIYQTIRQKDNYWKFILITLILGPSLYGFVDSVHRASRIMALVPASIILITLGLFTVLNSLKKYSIVLMILITSIYLFNFIDFAKYYWYTYPKFTENIFGNLSAEICYQTLHQQAIDRGLTPYIEQDIYNGFFDLIYSGKPSKTATNNSPPPAGSIFLTTASTLPGFTNSSIKLPHFQILISQ